MAKFSAGREGEDSEERPSSSTQKKKNRRSDGEEGRASGERGSKRTQQHSVSAGSDTKRDDSIYATFTDPDVLDCSICSEPLAPPVFQCENGHIACSSCCGKLKNKCATCSLAIGCIRCLAIEKILESIKVPCQNANYGCQERFSYVQKKNHEDKCIFVPCMCPLSDCAFWGSSDQLSSHCSSKHLDSVFRFWYHCPVSVSLYRDHRVLVLQAEEDGCLFLLNNKTELIGNMITVTCIDPSTSKGGFPYEVISGNGKTILKMESFTKSSNGRKEDPATEFLLVPCGNNGMVNMEIRIWKRQNL